MEVIVGDFGIVVVPRDAADTDRIMNHSSILRKYKVSGPSPCWRGSVRWSFCDRPRAGGGGGAGGVRVQKEFSVGAGDLPSLLCSQNNIMVVKDDINHPMSVVSSTKSRYV